MAHTTCEIVWMKHLLEELAFSQSSPMNLFCDNQVTAHIASNPVFREWTKHIEVNCYFIRVKLAEKVVHTVNVKSADQ